MNERELLHASLTSLLKEAETGHITLADGSKLQQLLVEAAENEASRTAVNVVQNTDLVAQTTEATRAMATKAREYADQAQKAKSAITHRLDEVHRLNVQTALATTFGAVIGFAFVLITLLVFFPIGG